ncbi:signal recognition particle [Methylacidiphilum kamchatkense Kam1]|uniref:Signal recognition particle n=1 Tax=Methylacidiphilum kamchatkense Kam1 TaxID=1202785 RepID=A0A0C1UQN9_9BACT|nr:signal recognition particle-docking protein FtsY [Methylacidiphilum kamchatkense]KIE58664.1 signal recognition particle [Methylacidiphilum kamchatkense Kam1]QDQ41949.1 fused signal recognition particle receptor [Methylacidiphilum kamchatkense Kam1]
MSFWKNLVGKFTTLIGQKEQVDWEAILIESDLGINLSQKLYSLLEKEKLLNRTDLAEKRIRNELIAILGNGNLSFPIGQPGVILLVGVNGGGKTTTAAKLAYKFKSEGKKVYLAACDTFRAAATEQLKIWAEKLELPVISAKEGADAASVAFRAYSQASQSQADYLIVDTAGRQANKKNLMLELGKIKKTLEKASGQVPLFVLLVVDGTSGSNVLVQAREFHEALGLSAMVVTKLDSSAKGGMIAAVKYELGIPTLFIGRGENLEALEAFSPEGFIEEFFSR